MNAKSTQHALSAALLNRRQVLCGLAAASATLGLGFAQTTSLPLPGDVYAPMDTCPPNPDAGIVDWTPDVLHPVSYGLTELDADEAGAPMRLRLYYPSHQLTERDAAIRPLLKMCNVRWPLVLFLHGLPPCASDITNPDYFLRWTRFARVLARSGYVVAIPSYEVPDPMDATHPTIARVMSVIDWVRGVRIDSSHPGAARAVGAFPTTRWEHADWVHPRATAIVGHSFGALLAARVAQARPNISSFVSLGGGFARLGDPVPILQSIRARKFFMWGVTANISDLTHENLDAEGLWSSIPQPKHAAISNPGEHFDYIRLRSPSECFETSSFCAGLRKVAPDLTALFIARHTPVGASLPIPLSLIPPNVTRTPIQQFFAGSHLSSGGRLEPDSTCRMTVRWETPEGSGTA